MTPAAEDVPIACTLDAGTMADRLDEWRNLVASFVVSVEVDPTTVRLVLEDSDAALVTASSLGQREKQCCAFFEVSIELEAERRSLVLRVPDGAEDALAAFKEVLTS
jgi:hypothetical protein